MKANQIIQPYELWKRGLWVASGAAAMLLISALTGFRHMHKIEVLEWYFIWLGFQLLVSPVGFYLILAPKWRRVPFSEKKGLVFGYLVIAWVSFLSFIIQTLTDPRNLEAFGFWLIILAAFFGLALGGAYWLVEQNVQEEIFP